MGIALALFNTFFVGQTEDFFRVEVCLQRKDLFNAPAARTLL
jgi:hypothetical protein